MKGYSLLPDDEEKMVGRNQDDSEDKENNSIKSEFALKSPLCGITRRLH